MSAIGPDLPPHLLAKRKRKQGEATQDKPATASGAKPSASPDGGEKRRKVIGPAMPPAPLDERPSEPPTAISKDVGSDESDDDDFGPALPSANATFTGPDHSTSTMNTDNTTPPPPEKTQRDAWMTMPPTQDDLAARLDPSKQRARGFNTGKGAKGPNTPGEDNSAWNETPEQKRKRLQDQMMGVSKPAARGPQAMPAAAVKRKGVADLDDEAKEQIAKSRGPSLMDRHEKTKGPDIDDDPSKRAFDREKDMGVGMRIDNTKRKQLLNQASGFSGKFAGGSYL